MNDENDEIIGFIYNLGINNKLNVSNEDNYQKSDYLVKDNNNNNLLKENSETNTINEDQNVSDLSFTIRNLEKYFYRISPSSNHPINPHNKPQISNNNQTNQSNSILECFPFPPKFGLQNVKAKYLMKATLQCFCNILHFVGFFKSNSKVEETINKCLIEKKISLTSFFKILNDNLRSYRNEIQEYYYGKNANNNYFISQEFNVAKYSEDLLNFIIMTLHEELNEAPKDSIYNYGDNNYNINLYNNYEALQYFLNNFGKENSIISKEFYAAKHTLTKCSQCQFIKNNYQKYYFLIFPLEEIRKYKLGQMMNMCQNMFNTNPFLFQQNLQIMQNTNSVTLVDCFDYNEKIDIFQGQNTMYCNICKAQLTSFYQTKLYTGPEILIIILDSGKEIDFKVKLEFDLFIDVTSYIEQKENNGWKYELIGVVTQIKKNNVSGPFIAFCKSPIDGGWYQYNDELVFEVKDFVKEIRDNIIPEILFYQKINN